MVAGSNLFKHKILTLCYKFNIVLALGNNGIFKLHLSRSSSSSYRGVGVDGGGSGCPHSEWCCRIWETIWLGSQLTSRVLFMLKKSIIFFAINCCSWEVFQWVEESPPLQAAGCLVLFAYLSVVCVCTSNFWVVKRVIQSLYTHWGHSHVTLTIGAR